jgi:8-oxo-dGTP diphosphatase
MLRDDKPGLSFANHWNVVGGGVEPGESLEAAIVRETLEETGLRIADYGYFGAFEGRSHLCHFFYSRVDTPAEQLTLGEGQEQRFFSAEEALGLTLVPVTAAALRVFFASPEYAALLP